MLTKFIRFNHVLGLTLMFIPFITFSSVVMTGTRIIYNESNKEKTVQFSNTGQTPYVVDISINDNKNTDTDTDINKEKNDIFIAIPQIFKIEPHAGQIIKLIKLADNLPNDKESVLYFNFSQIPATTEEQSSQNQLALLFNSQVKIFYRPKSIENKENTLNDLFVSKEINRLKINNDSPFHIVIKEANLISEKNKFIVAKSVMLSPKSVYFWDIPSKVNKNSAKEIEFEIINDYGSSQFYSKKLN